MASCQLIRLMTESGSFTGMLLEQHKDAVLRLLSDPKLLEEQVNFALKTLKEYVIYCRFSEVKYKD